MSKAHAQYAQPEPKISLKVHKVRRREGDHFNKRDVEGYRAFVQATVAIDGDVTKSTYDFSDIVEKVKKVDEALRAFDQRCMFSDDM